MTETPPDLETSAGTAEPRHGDGPAGAPSRVRRILAPDGTAAGTGDAVELDYAGRFLRRRRLVSRAGRAFLIDLPKATELPDGAVLELDDGSRIAVAAASEPLLEVRGDLARLAWHIGNRHTPCQLAADHLVIGRDHVLADMLTRLGADLRETTGPFRPEGGAYGQGRTFGHDHGPADGLRLHDEAADAADGAGPDPAGDDAHHDVAGHGHGHDHEHGGGHAHGHDHAYDHDHDHDHGHHHPHAPVPPAAEPRASRAEAASRRIRALLRDDRRDALED